MELSLQTISPLTFSAAQPLSAEGAESLTVPGGAWVLTAEFERDGADLYIRGDGHSALIKGYFDGSEPPLLLTEGGARVTPDMINSLMIAPTDGAVVQADAVTAAIESIGTVDSVRGTVTARHTDGTESVLKAGAPVYEGDVLQTESGSFLGVTFADETVFSLGPGARMVLDSLVYDPSGGAAAMQATVMQGAFSFISGLVAKTGPDAMTVETPTATIGVRGTMVVGRAAQEGEQTTFSLLPDPDGTVGQVAISNSAGLTLLSDPGATITVVSFTAPPPPPVTLPVSQVYQTFANELGALPKSPIYQQPNVPPSQQPDNQGDGQQGNGEGQQDQQGQGEDAPQDGEQDGEQAQQDEGGADGDGDDFTEASEVPGQTSPEELMESQNIFGYNPLTGVNFMQLSGLDTGALGAIALTDVQDTVNSIIDLIGMGNDPTSLETVIGQTTDALQLVDSTYDLSTVEDKVTTVYNDLTDLAEDSGQTITSDDLLVVTPYFVSGAVASTGTTTVVGNLLMSGTDAVLYYDVFDPTSEAGVGYDYMTVGGLAKLAGTLNVTANTYTNVPGDTTYHLMTYGTHEYEGATYNFDRFTAAWEGPMAQVGPTQILYITADTNSLLMTMKVHTGTTATTNADTLTASNGTGMDVLIGMAGDDIISGDGGEDILAGSPGNDTLIPANDGFGMVEGGFDGPTNPGTDKLIITYDSDLTLVDNWRVSGIEQIDLTTEGANSLKLDNTDVLWMTNDSIGNPLLAGTAYSDTNDTLVIDVDKSTAMDTINLATTESTKYWVDSGNNVTLNGETYSVYQHQNADGSFVDATAVIMDFANVNLNVSNGSDAG